MEEREGIFMPDQATAVDYNNVTCSFCGLLCDDLIIHRHKDHLEVIGCRCPKAVAGFERPWVESSPRVEGAPASLEQAIKKAAAVLRKANQPLFAGLATDVDGMRAVMQLAERTKGVLDHMAGEVMMRNVRAVQSQGWIMTTLGEIKNRADLIVFVGTDVHKEFPRFFERVVWNKEALFDLHPEERQIVYLGKGLNTEPGRSPKGREPLHLPCDIDRLGEVIVILRALLAGQKVQAKRVAGVMLAQLEELVGQLRAAHYGVVAWDAGKFNFPHADLTVQAICDLVRDLNHDTRFSGFNLGGSDGGMSAQSVCAWQSGYPLRVSYAQGHPDYDPLRYATNRLLAEGEADAMVWISSITAGRMPPPTKIPTIVLMEPGVSLPQVPEVYIPVATPGLDHPGRLIRCDNVVSLPLKQVRDVALPGVASVINTIVQAL